MGGWRSLAEKEREALQATLELNLETLNEMCLMVLREMSERSEFRLFIRHMSLESLGEVT